MAIAGANRQIRARDNVHVAPLLFSGSGSSDSVDDSVQGSGQKQFNYSGNWDHCTGVLQCGDPAGLLYSNSNRWSNTTNNDTVTVAFMGTGINLYGVCDPGHGIGAICIDGGAETTVDFYRATRVGNPLLWTSSILSQGTHTFKLRATGTHSSGSNDNYVTPDRIDILTGQSQQISNLATSGTVSASSFYGSGWETGRAIDDNVSIG